MATNIYLVRHGETDWNRERRYHGSVDLEMNERGLDQIRALGERFAGKHFDAVYSSPLGRARATAEAVVGDRDIPIAVEPGLVELGFGSWEGLSHEDLVKQEAGAYFDWLADPVEQSPPGGESIGEMARRAGAAIRSMVEAHPDGSVLAATHAGPIRVILCDALGLDLRNFLRIVLDPGGVSIVTYWGEQGAVRLVNDTSHWRGR